MKCLGKGGERLGLIYCRVGSGEMRWLARFEDLKVGSVGRRRWRYGDTLDRF